MRYLLSLLTLLLSAAVGLSAAQAQTGPPLTTQQQKNVEGLQIAKKDPFGEYLTDTHGRSVYIFSKDKAGASLCTGPCLKGWPPVRSSGQPKAGDGVDQNKIGLTQQSDGAAQITYDNHPLYYYKQDEGTQATSGQNAYSYDGNWYLLAPSGNAIETKRPGEIPQER